MAVETIERDNLYLGDASNVILTATYAADTDLLAGDIVKYDSSATKKIAAASDPIEGVVTEPCKAGEYPTIYYSGVTLRFGELQVSQLGDTDIPQLPSELRKIGIIIIGGAK